TPLSGLQLNASANVPGSFSYSPSVGAILPPGNGQSLSVTFVPNNTVTYAVANKIVPIDVALQSSNPIVRVAYIVPTNRVAQSHAAPTLRSLLLQYQEFFADQMSRNGFGRKTFAFETEPDGVTPFIHQIKVSATDNFLRGDLSGNRVLDAARGVGLPVGAPAQIWWLIAETHIQQVDGSFNGGFAIGQRFPAAPSDAGWAISSSADLALYQLQYQTNSLPYHGAVIPELGPNALVQDISFPWFNGITLSGVSSAAMGTGLRNLGEALGLDHDYRNDENFNGNLMGFGASGLRGVLYPKLYSYNSCVLSYASALALSVSPFFNADHLVTDVTAPTVNVLTAGNQNAVNGLLEISFNAADEHALHAALLTWQMDGEFVLAEEMALSGTNAGGTFRVPHFTSSRTNRYTVTVFDHQGNRRSVETTIYPSAGANQAPQPYVRVTPVNVGLGEDVFLDASDSFDPGNAGALFEVEWDVDGDGAFDTFPTTDPFYVANYYELGTRLVRARLTDPAGATAISAPVAVNVDFCATVLSPMVRTNGFGNSTGTVRVVSGSKCIWTVINTNDWITILSAPENIGSNQVTYAIEPNPFFEERRGSLFIGDRVFTVVQRAAICTYSVSPTNRFHGFSLGANTFKVNTRTNCTWAVVNNNPWITITSGATGTNDDGIVSYSINSENRVSGYRTGQIFVEGAAYTVTQWGTNCEMVLSPIARTHTENSETGSVTVSTGGAVGGCLWSITENTNSWITITSIAAGSFSYVLETNLTLAPRMGVMKVNGQPFTVIQGTCSFAIEPLMAEHTFGMTSSNIAVTAGPVCEWTVSNTNSWISINSSLTAHGTGVVSYTVFPNPHGTVREGTILVAGQEYLVLQAPKVCLLTLSTNEETHLEEGGHGEVSVFGPPGCLWTAESSASWVRIVDGEFGDGSNTVTYVVDKNDGPARSVTLTIANKDFTVTQPSGIRVITASDLIVASGQTNFLTVTLGAHGTENRMGFSFCFDTNMLGFVSARLGIEAPAQMELIVNSNETTQGHVGFNVAMLPGRSMPLGTGTTVQVFFRGLPVNGTPTTTLSFCDSPVARSLFDGLNEPLTPDFRNGFAQVRG
ncbi:MAG TPA: BACON domain-containing carbohydrate-binding protein, partial [Candidatus Limnocylindria bacterium]|nr:BACON domain-containing carbohydrate-binding protein [Candidatus Limnocylindria bacterium]